jgi:hypothetical protein
MNVLVLSLSKIYPENIYLTDSHKNILMEGLFTKIIFMNPFYTINEIYISLPIYEYSTQILPEFHSKKKMISFSTEQNTQLLYNVYNLEKYILQKYIPTNPSKFKTSYISNTLYSGKFIINHDSSNKNESKNILGENTFILKISGIWENEIGYGITYKIMDTSYS